ncbi:MAG: rubredoxin [Pseudomonadales bacterium]|nr:rubredoxin [Pseudomonadales bacterium]MDG2079708.1 rubredoxin [Pseudomonadales bacterium]
MAKYQCPDCGYIYDEATGNEHEGYEPGTRFEDLSDDFACPACFVRDKEDFVLLEKSSLKK